MDRKLKDLPIMSSIAGGDLLYVVDISDTTDSPQGTSKQMTATTLFSFASINAVSLNGKLTPTSFTDGYVLTYSAAAHSGQGGYILAPVDAGLVWPVTVPNGDVIFKDGAGNTIVSIDNYGQLLLQNPGHTNQLGFNGDLVWTANNVLDDGAGNANIEGTVAFSNDTLFGQSGQFAFTNGASVYTRFGAKADSESVWSINVDQNATDHIDDATKSAIKLSMQNNTGYDGLVLQYTPPNIGTWNGSIHPLALDFETGALTLANVDGDYITVNPYTQSIAFANGTFLQKGTFDNGFGGAQGISMVCAVAYELNWQAGHLSSTTNNGTTPAPIQLDSTLQFNGSNLITDSNTTTVVDVNNRYLHDQYGGIAVNFTSNASSDTSSTLKVDNDDGWVTVQGVLYGDSGGDHYWYISPDGSASFAQNNFTINSSGNIGGPAWEIDAATGQTWLDDGSISTDSHGVLTAIGFNLENISVGYTPHIGSSSTAIEFFGPAASVDNNGNYYGVADQMTANGHALNTLGGFVFDTNIGSDGGGNIEATSFNGPLHGTADNADKVLNSVNSAYEYAGASDWRGLNGWIDNCSTANNASNAYQVLNQNHAAFEYAGTSD